MEISKGQFKVANRNEPISKFFTSIYEATNDAALRKTSVWRNGNEFASATYDGLQDDLGWNGASGYVFVPKECRPTPTA